MNRESAMEKEDEKGQKCQVCGKRKLSVHHRPNAYAQEVHNDPTAFHVVCDECDYQNAQDI